MFTDIFNIPNSRNRVCFILLSFWTIVLILVNIDVATFQPNTLWPSSGVWFDWYGISSLLYYFCSFLLNQCSGELMSTRWQQHMYNQCLYPLYHHPKWLQWCISGAFIFNVMTDLYYFLSFSISFQRWGIINCASVNKLCIMTTGCKSNIVLADLK